MCLVSVKVRRGQQIALQLNHHVAAGNQTWSSTRVSSALAPESLIKVYKGNLKKKGIRLKGGPVAESLSSMFEAMCLILACF